MITYSIFVCDRPWESNISAELPGGESVYAETLRELREVVRENLPADADIQFVSESMTTQTTISIRKYDSGVYKAVLGNCDHFCATNLSALFDKIEHYLTFGEPVSPDNEQPQDLKST